MDVYCKDKKCPICEGHMKHLRDDSLRCTNNCYNLILADYFMGNISHFVMFFPINGCTNDPKDYLCLSHDSSSEILEEVKQRIEYWKKDYRYLAEILERN